MFLSEEPFFIPNTTEVDTHERTEEILSTTYTKTLKTPYIFSEPTACLKFRQCLKESKLSTALSEF